MLYKNINFELLNHDTVRITTPDKKFIYIDPYQLDASLSLPKAEYVFISHTHRDHLSIEDIKLIATKDTIIVSVPDAVSKLNELTFKNLVIMEQTDKKVIDNLTVRTIPAYNIDKWRTPHVPYHPKESGFVGFIISINDKATIYFAGDTDATKEMLHLHNIDVAFLPVSGKYVMTAQEAADATKQFKPKFAVPMHYGAIVGSVDDAKEFLSLLEDNQEVQGRILLD